MGTTLTLNSRLLAIIAQRNPTIYDIVIPRFACPSAEPWISGKYSPVAVNPQPLPPSELGALVASEFIQMVWFANRFGLDASFILDDLDDWCPTYPKWPKNIPWLTPQSDFPRQPLPEPPSDWLLDFHLGFAARLATAQLEESMIGEIVTKAFERSAAVIESEKIM
ncbi:hypothetical protein [Acinetobacter tibetensis]|uniref:Uncharacterized protein n=1 Tax=Acinetobacter tibetensis TaxID=2943497 RepID=A0AAE9LR32_9GAMM|nr:hypothetical protein [Acinetobacter tibetensis]USE83113.1 hypothetical protein M5E07_15290 [Acinetobacter tibetensis]